MLRNEVGCQLSDKEEKERSGLWKPKMSEQCEKTCYIIFRTSAVLHENREEGRREGRWEGEAIKWGIILYFSY